MPKVLRIINRFNLGGPTYNAAYLTRYLAPEFETRLVAGLKDDSEASSEFIIRDLGLTPEYVPGMKRSINPLNDLKAYWHIRKLIREIKPDIVHTHAAKAGALGRLAAIHERVPVIVHTYHGHVFHSYFNSIVSKVFLLIERYLARKSQGIIAISDKQFNELCHEFHVAPADKFHIVPLGFDLERFQRDISQKRASFRAEYQIPDDTIAIGIIGRLVPVKNHKLFLDGIKYLVDHSSRKFKALIVGDGESRAEIEAYAQSLGLSFSTEKDTTHDKTLVFTSWRKDIDVVNAGLDIVCLTSLNEGTPVSLIEAQAADKPIVSTRVGGIADVVIEGQTALLSDLDDAQTFYTNLLQVLENDEQRVAMSQNANQHVFAKFHYTRLVNDMRAVYHKLLDQSRQG